MRIIAGQYKGRRLLPPRGHTTRPITDRVKTALFSILAADVDDAVVLDLFAGTGSLGIEAISRGARRCYFAERDRLAIARLRRNITAVGADDRCEVWPGDIFRTLRRRLAPLPDPVDLAFIDPPYRLVANWRWDDAAEKLFAPIAAAAAPDATAILRCERNISLPEAFGPLCVRDRRDYGNMSLVFLSACGADGGQC